MIVLESRIIIAGPTVGKSRFEETAGSEWTIIDTDRMLASLCMSWFKDKLWQVEKTKANNIDVLQKTIYSSLGIIVRLFLERDTTGRVVVISNIWSEEFFLGCGPELAPNGKCPIMLFRDSGQSIHDVSVERSGGKAPIPVAIADKWVVSAKKFGPKVSANFILVGDNEYLSEVISLPTEPFKPLKAAEFDPYDLLFKGSKTSHIK